ncbi:hypothetical protein [Streptomyces sp. NPDC058614]|uniref:hypothetical protein n=1 Tax=Streptomyces sp. NPDC058614 TaxID=3346557 RepID=UPI00364B206E
MKADYDLVWWTWAELEDEFVAWLAEVAQHQRGLEHREVTLAVYTLASESLDTHIRLHAERALARLASIPERTSRWTWMLFTSLLPELGCHPVPRRSATYR